MKTQKHLPIFGVGPIYVLSIAVLSFAAYQMRNLPALSSGRIDVLQKPLFILSVILIVLGVFIWFQAAVVSRLLDGIVKNRLVTTGIYAWVRNPLYTAFVFVCTGVILMAGNLWFFFLPFVFWGFMTVLMKHTEEKWLQDLYGKQYD
ncbi:MAG: isoprenylcysteine carboxylmethyltransferase family protein, partial [Lentisphaeria bacterium]|nr:isoprenylcysteine carboxylmethyltransferase family protein [Lentisphaeria bacterium]